MPVHEKKEVKPPVSDTNTEQQPLPIIPPSVAPPPVQVTPVVKPEDRKPAQTKEDDKKKVIDTGIKPQKPIDIRPTLFPNLNQ
jgi:hypothetical protein